jgi:hypothetical protein
MLALRTIHHHCLRVTCRGVVRRVHRIGCHGPAPGFLFLDRCISRFDVIKVRSLSPEPATTESIRLDETYPEEILSTAGDMVMDVTSDEVVCGLYRQYH